MSTANAKLEATDDRYTDRVDSLINRYRNALINGDIVGQQEILVVAEHNPILSEQLNRTEEEVFSNPPDLQIDWDRVASNIGRGANVQRVLDAGVTSLQKFELTIRTLFHYWPIFATVLFGLACIVLTNSESVTTMRHWLFIALLSLGSTAIVCTTSLWRLPRTPRNHPRSLETPSSTLRRTSHKRKNIRTISHWRLASAVAIPCVFALGLWSNWLISRSDTLKLIRSATIDSTKTIASGQFSSDGSVTYRISIDDMKYTGLEAKIEGVNTAQVEWQIQLVKNDGTPIVSTKTTTSSVFLLLEPDKQKQVDSYQVHIDLSDRMKNQLAEGEQLRWKLQTTPIAGVANADSSRAIQ